MAKNNEYTWTLPLYSGLGFKNKKCLNTNDFPADYPNLNNSANLGLIYDKYFARWQPNSKWQPDNEAKKDFFNKIICRFNKPGEVQKALLKDCLLRRQRLIENTDGTSRTFTTSWRFISGLGMGHVLETGFLWHRTLGVPYLPGSSIKGMMRAWARPENYTEDYTKYKVDCWAGLKDHKKFEQLFGSAETGAGSLIVFDALPTTWPGLELDIINPHYGPYYNDPQNIPPADYHSPVPIFFLTVAPDMPFTFSIAPRPGKGTVDDLHQGLKLLKAALETIGAGAKTAVGYGNFDHTEPWESVEEECEKRNKEAAKKREAARIAALLPAERAVDDLKKIQDQTTDKDYQIRVGFYKRLMDDQYDGHCRLKIAELLHKPFEARGFAKKNPKKREDRERLANLLAIITQNEYHNE